MTINRITVLNTVHHECQGEQPRTIQSAYSDGLQTDEEAYTRRHKAEQVRYPLDTGWIPPDKAGLIIIENLEGRDLLVNLSEEEKQLLAGKYLELRLDPDSKQCIIMPPRMSICFLTSHVEDAVISAPNGPVQYRVTVLPK